MSEKVKTIEEEIVQSVNEADSEIEKLLLLMRILGTPEPKETKMEKIEEQRHGRPYFPYDNSGLYLPQFYAKPGRLSNKEMLELASITSTLRGRLAYIINKAAAINESADKVERQRLNANSYPAEALLTLALDIKGTRRKLKKEFYMDSLKRAFISLKESPLTIEQEKCFALGNKSKR